TATRCSPRARRTSGRAWRRSSRSERRSSATREAGDAHRRLRTPPAHRLRHRTGSTPCTPLAVGRLTVRRSKDRERAIESRTEAGRRRPPSARRGVPDLDADAALLRGARQTGYPERVVSRVSPDEIPQGGTMKARTAVLMFTVVTGAGALSAGVDVARAQCKPLCERQCDVAGDMCKGQADLQQAISRSQCQLNERMARLACNATLASDLAACAPACGAAQEQCEHDAKAKRDQCSKTAHDARDVCTKPLNAPHDQAKHACDATRDACHKMCK